MSVEATGAVVEAAPTARWYHKLGSVLLAVFCFEMGVFLIVFPWMDAWQSNYFAYLAPETYRAASFAGWWRDVWLSPQFRGAVSGLGVINIYIAILEFFRLRRFASVHPAGAAPESQA